MHRYEKKARANLSLETARSRKIVNPNHKKEVAQPVA
jgi:Cu2+-containing amine oxidase